MSNICFPQSLAFCEVMLKNAVEPDRSQMTIKYGEEKMRFASRITKSRIQTHIAFPWQQWLRESATVLRYITLCVFLL